MPGTDNLKILLDSDAIVAFFVRDDLLYGRVQKIARQVSGRGAQLYCCTTTLAEVMTVFQRVFNQGNYAEQAYELIVGGKVQLVVVDAGLFKSAFDVFLTSHSKKNTIFDAINIAAVKKYDLDAIFSFDGWYRKHGVKLAGDLI